MTSTVHLSGASQRKSSRSGNLDNCVEVAAVGPTVAVRDSKDPSAGILAFPTANWSTFLNRG